MQRSSRGLSMALAFGLLSSCNLAKLPGDTVFHCEADGTCGQSGFVCGGDRVCRPPVVVEEDAGENDAGGLDAGELDAGVEDAGLDDAGFDAGFDAGIDDAGTDAGLDDAGTDAGCVPTGGIDEPDPAGLDLNCDGFDGDLSRAVFVDWTTGNDTNAGTRAAPVHSLAHAASLGKEQIYLSTGMHFGNTTLPDAVAVFGGCDLANAWVRTTTRAVLVGALIASPADAGRVVLDRLEVQAPAASAFGEAAVAVTLINASASSRLSECRLVGGTGSIGADGTAAPPVNAGNAGLAGTADGGLGGAGANCDDAGTSPSGFGGGGVMPDGTGLAGADVTLGGAGSLAKVCDAGACVGIDGGNGSAGTMGLASSVRPADPPAGTLGSVTATGWQGVTLGTWVPAQSGRPGGGGGAGGGLLNLASVLLARGGGAGGGGSGGCGGRSGAAGQAGGASIGLVLFDSSPTLSEVVLVSTQGGRGGNGGAAGSGGASGPGGAGEQGETVAAGSAGVGGRGAAGGAGVPGRQGPGGWGGPVVGLFCGGTSAPVLDGTTTWAPGTPGAGGNGDPNGPAGGQPSIGFKVNCP